MPGKITFTNAFTGKPDAVTQNADGSIVLSSNGQVIGQGSSAALLLASQKFDGTSRRIATGIPPFGRISSS